MNSTSIVKKLNEFLSNHSRFEDECEVVYFMVKIRKIIDIEKSNLGLRFYCNWILHNKLDRPQTTAFLAQKFAINNISQLNAQVVARQLKTGHSDFFKLNDLKDELKNFCKQHNSPSDLLTKNWAEFRKLFLESIQECPVIFTSTVLHSLELKKKDDKNYEYKFSFFTLSRDKALIKLKLKS